VKKIFIVASFAFTLVLFLLPTQSMAQSPESGIQISPVTCNYEISPGGVKDSVITLKNLGKEEIEYTIETENFVNTTEDGAPVFAFGPVKEGVTTLANWFDFPKGKTGKIPAEGSVEVGFRISIPKGSEPGGHYAAVFAKMIAKTEEGKTELGVSSRVGTLFLVTVPGEVRYGAEIEELSAPKFVWAGPVTFGMKVRNTGTVHYDSKSSISLSRALIGGETEIDMGQHTVLPGSSRVYEGKWSNKYPFGYYKLTATATAGSGNAPTLSGAIIAVPLIIVLPVIIGLILLVYLVRYIKKHVKIVK